MRSLNHVIGVCGILIGLGFVCPQLQQMQTDDQLTMGGFLLLALGLLLTIGGCLAIGLGIRRKMLR